MVKQVVNVYEQLKAKVK